jgi:hypothetical protein
MAYKRIALMTADQALRRRETQRRAAARQRERAKVWDVYQPELMRVPPKSIDETIAAFKPAAESVRNEKLGKPKGF